MLAWTLKTSAENGASTGRVEPSSVGRGRGAGASRSTASSSRRTPKFETADPKKTGVQAPRANASASNCEPAASRSSSSSCAVLHASPSRASACSGVSSSSGAAVAPPAVRVNRWNVPVERSTTPRKSPGMPTGQVAATGAMPSTDSTWSSISSGSMPGRSYLLTNVRSGMPRARATSNSRRVCGSTPRAASSSMTAASAALSTRSVSSEKSRWPGRVEEVQHDAVVLEAQHRGGDRDPAPALDLHPVRRRGPAAALGAHGAGLEELPAVQQELLGQRGLARVRVGDDREGAAPCRLVQDPLRTRRDGGHVGHRGVSSA